MEEREIFKVVVITKPDATIKIEGEDKLQCPVCYCIDKDTPVRILELTDDNVRFTMWDIPYIIRFSNFSLECPSFLPEQWVKLASGGQLSLYEEEKFRVFYFLVALSGAMYLKKNKGIAFDREEIKAKYLG